MGARFGSQTRRFGTDRWQLSVGGKQYTQSVFNIHPEKAPIYTPPLYNPCLGQLLQLRADRIAVGGRELGHDDADQLFLRIGPEVRARHAAPAAVFCTAPRSERTSPAQLHQDVRLP